MSYPNESYGKSLMGLVSIIKKHISNTYVTNTPVLFNWHNGDKFFIWKGRKSHYSDVILYYLVEGRKTTQEDNDKVIDTITPIILQGRELSKSDIKRVLITLDKQRTYVNELCITVFFEEGINKVKFSLVKVK